ncbi:autotransporter domain-containing protein [Dyella choica]|uniref:Autotransporter domain-containing protein n=1 Tax=Dyella choica TaxID=1927959 RepID=A0A432M0Y6_9GAMM|nr:autotransporter domain-containing protein [Dyella choica]RUL70880.1 autotransporter domain-containing protein [Dyella choica]
MKARSTRRSAGHSNTPRLLTAMIAVALAASWSAHAQTFVPAGPGVESGPSFLMNGGDNPQPGQPTNTVPYYATQSGAIQSIAVNPFNAQLMLVSSPSGGIFRSADGGKSWAAMTDSLGSLAVSNISFDTTDASGNTLVASIGSTTNGATGTHFDRGGLTNQGLLYSSDGGKSWNAIGQGSLPDVSMLNVVARGQVIMAAGFEEEGEKPNGPNTGLYRSADGGKTFTRVDQIAGSGLPPGPTSALVGDPTDPNRFYVGVSGTSNTAVYTSGDGGKTWSPIFSAANANGSINANTPTMLRVAAGPNGSVVVGVVNMALGQLNNAFLSSNGGKSWVDLSPSLAAGTVSNESGGVSRAGAYQLKRYGEVLPGVAINQGGQAMTNSLVAIDPQHPNVVYVAGDGRYDNVTGSTFEGVSAIRVVVNADGTITYAPLTDNYTSDHSTVHPDARAFAFDGHGNLLMSTDGGLYSRTNPSSDNGVWRGLNNGRQALEIYSLALDPNTGQIALAAQDNGAARQLPGHSSIYQQIGGGDGSLAVINGQSTPGYSYTYVASQYLGGLTRYETDAKGNYVNTVPWTDAKGNVIASLPNLPVSTDLYFAPDSTGQFATVANQYVGTNVVELDKNTINFVNPFVLNHIDHSLMATGVTPGVMVSQDNFNVAPTPYVAGDTACSQGCYQILPSYFAGNSGFVSALDFGTNDNTYALLAGTYLYQDPVSGNYARLFASTGTSLSSINLQPVFAYPVAMHAPNAVLFDPRSQSRFFAAAPGKDGNGFLWGTVDGGTTGKDLTANLPANFIRPDALAFINSNGVNALLVGGMNSAANAGNPLVSADSDANGNLSNWRRLGNGLPNVQITQIDYQPGLDAMAIGTYGRGAWMLYDVTSNYASATVLQFGLANNDSNPDSSLLTGNRPLIKYGTGTLTITGNASYTGGTTINAGAVVLNGSVLNNVALNSGATLTGAGSASGQLNVLGGLVAPGSANGTTLTVGSLANQGGTLLFSYGASGQNTHLTVTGQANIGGLKLLLAPTSTPAPFYSSYNLLSAGSLIGQFANASSASGPTAWVNLASMQPTPNQSQPVPASVQPALMARVEYLGNVSLEILNPQNWTAATGNRNQYAVGQALNGLQYTASASMLSALGSAASGNVPVNLEAISGESSVASARAINLAGDRFQAAVGEQMLDAPGCLDGQADPAGCRHLGKDVGDHRVWVQATDIGTRVNGEFQSNRFDGNGIALGGEVALGEQSKLGFALGHSNVDTRTPALSSSVHSDYNLLAAYGAYQRGSWFIGGVLSYVNGWSRADRTMVLGTGGMQTVSGKPNANALALQVASGFDIRLAHGWFVQPYAEFAAARSWQQSYAESSSNALALSYGHIDQTRYDGDLGVKLGTTFQTGTTTIKPYLGLAEAGAWGDRRPQTQVAFVDAPGASFLVSGNSVPSAWLKAQAGVQMNFGKSVLFDVSYQGSLTGHVHDDFLNAGLSWRF